MHPSVYNRLHRYTPTEEEEDLFRRLKAFVYTHIGYFAQAGASLDELYSEVALARRSDDDEVGRRRVDPPPTSLADRYDVAFDETLVGSDSETATTSLQALPEAERKVIAGRWLLLPWIQLDPDRDGCCKVTKFQY